MKVLLIVLGVLFLIGCIPVGVLFRYHGEIELKLTVLFVKIGILPKKPMSKKKQEKAEAKKQAKAAKKAEAKEKKKKKQQAQSLIAKPPAPPKPKTPLPDRIRGLIPWAKLGANFVGEFFHRKLCVKTLRIRAALAGGNPAKLALTNGRAWEAIGVAVPILEQAFRIKKRQIVVYPDFLADKTDLEAELAIRVRVGGVVLIALKYGCKALALLIRKKLGSGRGKAEAAQPEPQEAANPESNENDTKVVS